MRTAAAFLVGLALGVAVLAGFLYSTGRLKTAESPQTLQAVTPVANFPPPNLPTAQAAPLPAPPNLALTSPPVPTEVIKMDAKLSTQTADVAPSRQLSIGLPIANLQKSQVQDTFNDTRGGGARHGASDIMASRGTPIHAVVEGNVMKLFNSKKGGTTLYQYDNAKQYCYYYAHLDRYADGIKEGMLLRKGDVLGYVGSTGDANPANPHLHLEILQLGPDKRWYEHTTQINPYPILMEALGAN